MLVVDDFEDAREMYLEYLQHVGFAVAGAKDGETAIDAARRLQPMVILMDLSLPKTNGLEATRILKADPSTRHILIVALTSHVGAAAREDARLVGCDLFVPKPCLPREVADHVVSLIKKAEASST